MVRAEQCSSEIEGNHSKRVVEYTDVIRFLTHYVRVTKCLTKTKYGQSLNQTVLNTVLRLRGTPYDTRQSDMNLIRQVYWTCMPSSNYNHTSAAETYLSRIVHIDTRMFLLEHLHQGDKCSTI